MGKDLVKQGDIFSHPQLIMYLRMYIFPYDGQKHIHLSCKGSLMLHGIFQKKNKSGKVETKFMKDSNTNIAAKGSIPVYQIQENHMQEKKKKLEELDSTILKKQKQPHSY
jgi:hypothetical protein